MLIMLSGFVLAAVSLTAASDGTETAAHLQRHQPAVAGSAGGAAACHPLDSAALPPTAPDPPDSPKNATTEFRWSYLPSHDTVRFVVLSPPLGATYWHVALAAAEGTPLIAESEGSLPLAAAGHTWAVPRLPASSETRTYSLTLSLATKRGDRPCFKQIGLFNRTLRPWEGNSLGKQDVIIPPFTPIRTARMDSGAISIGVIGRELTLSSTGLWAQVAVTSELRTAATAARSPRRTPVQILSAPIELVAEFASGETHTATARPGGSSVVTAASGTSVQTDSSWTAGALSGHTHATYDYDGCVKLRLVLEPLAKPLLSLTLRIPVKNEEAPFMHTVTDLLRSHFAGRIPAGAGEVYNTTGIYRFELPGPAVPYLWVGGAERGVAVFNDNDKGWISAEPAYQLLRSGNSNLTIVANLVSSNSERVRGSGVSWNQQREIVLGMMATPAKPQPASPMGSARSWWPGEAGGSVALDQLALTMTGADFYQGAQSCCNQFYPVDHNYSLYNMFAHVRATGDTGRSNYSVPGGMVNDWIRSWVKNSQDLRALQCPVGVPGSVCKCSQPSQCAAARTAALKNIYSSVADTQHLLQKMHARDVATNATTAAPSQLLMPYTNPRGVIFDVDTDNYLDEWTDYDVADPRWTQSGFTCVGCKGVPTGFSWGRIFRNETAALAVNRSAAVGVWRGWSYATDPVASYADMALWEVDKMTASFADGPYYDDVFFHASYATVPGPGYVDDDGSLRAGVNLWAWRDFMRRSAVMQHTQRADGGDGGESSKRWTAIYAHMTNVNVVPVLSWATVGLDWEWRDQGIQAGQDVQTRNNIGCDDRGQQCNDTSFILAQSTGLQAGLISVAIASGLRGPQCVSRPELNTSMCKEWLLKTQYATTIPHEMRPAGHFWNSYTTIPASPDGRFEETPTVAMVPTLLSRFGYGDPACDIYRFWEPAFPIETSGAVVLPLVIQCPVDGDGRSNGGGSSQLDHRVLVFIGSFGPGGNVTVRLNRVALGLQCNARSVDAESQATLTTTCTSNGSKADLLVATSVDEHSFRIIEVGPRGTNEARRYEENQ